MSFIEVGRWTGPLFFWMCYADVFLDSDDTHPHVSFNGLTRRGVIRKANRYITSYKINSRFTYVYDGETHDLIEVIDTDE